MQNQQHIVETIYLLKLDIMVNMKWIYWLSLNLFIENVFFFSSSSSLQSVIRCSDNPAQVNTVRNCVPNECFDRCNLNPAKKAARRRLFASDFRVSEYMDNTSRIGHEILHNNLHDHRNCVRRACRHHFVVDMAKNVFHKPACKYFNRGCGFESKLGYQRKGLISFEC